MTKKQFKNFICAIFLIAVCSTVVTSCSMSKELGNSGVYIQTKYDEKAKTAYACIVADIEKLSTKAKAHFYARFPELKK